MTKKKHLTIKQILASCKQNLDPPDRLELIFQLLDDLPEHEFGEFAFRLNHPELLRKLYKADTVLTDTMTYRTALRFANEYGLLKAELAKTGRPTTFAGAEFKSFVYERKRNGRTEGEILDDARDKF